MRTEKKIDWQDGKWYGLIISGHKEKDKVVHEIYDLESGITESWID